MGSQGYLQTSYIRTILNSHLWNVSKWHNYVVRVVESNPIIYSFLLQNKCMKKFYANVILCCYTDYSYDCYYMHISALSSFGCSWVSFFPLTFLLLRTASDINLHYVFYPTVPVVIATGCRDFGDCAVINDPNRATCQVVTSAINPQDFVNRKVLSKWKRENEVNVSVSLRHGNCGVNDQVMHLSFTGSIRADERSRWWRYSQIRLYMYWLLYRRNTLYTRYYIIPL